MKLKINDDDGSITFPLQPLERGGDARTIVLYEPNMDEMARMNELADEADQKVGDIPQVSRDMTAQQLLDAQKQLRDRQLKTYGRDAPYGVALITVVNMLRKQSEPEVVWSDMFGWAMNVKALRAVMEHFQDPLPGQESIETE